MLYVKIKKNVRQFMEYKKINFTKSNIFFIRNILSNVTIDLILDKYTTIMETSNVNGIQFVICIYYAMNSCLDLRLHYS